MALVSTKKSIMIPPEKSAIKMEGIFLVHRTSEFQMTLLLQLRLYKCKHSKLHLTFTVIATYNTFCRLFKKNRFQLRSCSGNKS